MPLKILYIFLCFVSVHRSLGNGLDDAEHDIVQSLIANQTDLSTIAEISSDNVNVTRRNLGFHRTENKECEKAVTLKRTLKLLISLLNDSASTNSKTTDVLENLKDLLKNTPAGYAEVIDKIDDLVRTLDKYKEPDDKNDHVPLRSLTVNPKKHVFELDSRLKLNLEIPALANIYCAQQLLNILKATEEAYINLARNPVCEIDISDLPTIPNINPNPQFSDRGKSSFENPYAQNCAKCIPVRPDINIATPYHYPVFVDVNSDKNPPSPSQNPEDYDQVQTIIVNPNKNPPYYNFVDSGQVTPINVNPVSPHYYPYSSGQVLTVVNPHKNPGTIQYNAELFNVNPNKNPLLQEYNPPGPGLNYYPELFVAKPDKNPLIYEYNAPGPGPNYYPELFDVKPDKNPLLQEYNAYGPGPNYYPELFDVKPDKYSLLQDYNSFYSPGLLQPVDFNSDNNPGSKYYYPEFFDVTREKNPVAPDYNTYGQTTPYYYPEYVDVNLDKNPVAPYYNPDSIPHGQVNPWDKTPFPYDAAPETLPLNPIFPYMPQTTGYPNQNSENQKILPFEITPEVVNFVYPYLYSIPNQSKHLDFSENFTEPSVPIHQYPIFPPKEIAPLNPHSLYLKYPELNYGIYPQIANYVKQPSNSVLPYPSKTPVNIKPEPMYSENEVPTPQFLPKHNIPVNPGEITTLPDQNIADYPYTNQNIPNNYPIIFPVNSNFLPNDIPEYNIQPNNQYPSYPFYPSNEHEISPLNPYSPYVPNQLRPQQPLPNHGLINDVPKANKQKQPLKIIAFVREAIDVIQAVVPAVKFDRPTLHVIAKIKSILVPKDEDISHEQVSTILDLFGKVIEYVKQLEYYKQIEDIIDSHAVSNRQKLETEKIVELTYLLKQPKPVVYYPYYYVKYSMPYRNFMIVSDNLLRQKPELRDKPKELYEELLAISKVVDVSPDLKNYNKGDLLKLTVNAGSLVDTKFIEENDALQKQLNILNNITSDFTTDEILDLKETNNNYQQLTDTESYNQAPADPFVLRDKKEADPNIIIGMQRLNDLFNSPNSHSSTFNSDKLRDDILRGGKDSMNNQLSDAINDRDENNPPVNNWMQKLFEATKEASHPPNVMSSNGYVRIDNQKITMNSGSGNRQDSVSIFNPKSTMNLAASNSHDVGINFKSNPNDVNEFLKRYNGPDMINYDNQKVILNAGDSNNQNEVKITNPKFMPNEINAKESNAEDLDSTTEQDGLAIESNPSLKWGQLNTSYKPIPRPGSTKSYKINNMAGSNQVGVINRNVFDENLVMPNQPILSYGNNIFNYGKNSIPHQIGEVNDNEPLLISNDPTAVPESVAYYEINGMGMPNQVGGINNEEHLLISDNPTGVPGSVAYYGINGMGMPNQLGGINNEEQLLISNNPTAVPESVAYYTINGMEMPNQAGGLNNEQQLLISNNPTAVPGSVAYYAINGKGMPNQVGGINNPTSVHGNIAYYAINGMGMHNQAGGTNNDEQLLISKDPTAVPGGLLYYGINSGAANPSGVLGTQNTILHQQAEQLFPYELEKIVDAEPENNSLNEESIKESVFDDIQLTEKMKYNGNQSVGGGQGVINNVLQSITGHDHVLQYTVNSQDQLNLNNNGLYSADANQGIIEQQNLENNYIAMVGQNNYENDLYHNQQNFVNSGLDSPLGNAIGQNIPSTMVHHIAAPYSAAHNIMGYGPGGDVLGQKLVIQSVPIIFKRPYSYHQRITARRPVVVG